MGWFDPQRLIADRVYHFACSYACLDRIMKNKGPVDPTHNEREAYQQAAEDAGQYLTVLGKTDLAELEVDQWMEFIQGICNTYADCIQKDALKEDIPL